MKQLQSQEDFLFESLKRKDVTYPFEEISKESMKLKKQKERLICEFV